MSKSKRVPLVNQKVLHRLEEEFGDPAPAHSFVRDYISFWDERYGRLADAVRREDAPATLDALFSVRIASTMIGATRLARLAASLETSLKSGHLEAVAEALPDVRACGTETIRELTVHYMKSRW